MLIKLSDPMPYGECLGSSMGMYWTWWLLVDAGRVYASNRKRAKLEYIGRIA